MKCFYLKTPVCPRGESVHSSQRHNVFVSKTWRKKKWTGNHAEGSPKVRSFFFVPVLAATCGHQRTFVYLKTSSVLLQTDYEQEKHRVKMPGIIICFITTPCVSARIWWYDIYHHRTTRQYIVTYCDTRGTAIYWVYFNCPLITHLRLIPHQSQRHEWWKIVKRWIATSLSPALLLELCGGGPPWHFWEENRTSQQKLVKAGVKSRLPTRILHLRRKRGKKVTWRDFNPALWNCVVFFDLLSSDTFPSDESSEVFNFSLELFSDLWPSVSKRKQFSVSSCVGLSWWRKK